MTYFKHFLLLVGVMAGQIINANQEQEIIITGKELCALDDAFCIALDAAHKQQDQDAMTNIAVVRYFLRALSKDLLQNSTSQEAAQSAQELERRVSSNEQPTLNHNWQTKNNFSGVELVVLDDGLNEGCTFAVQEKDVELLLALLYVRCAILKTSIQLLTVSTHQDAREHQLLLSESLTQCTNFQQEILQQIEAFAADQKSNTRPAN